MDEGIVGTPNVSGDRDTRVIGVGNQKGGVAKTTNAVHLAAGLAEKGRKVLVWDLDVNGGATLHLGVPRDAYLGTFHILTGQQDPRELVLTCEEEDLNLPPNLDLIPASRDLEDLESTLRSKDRFFTPHALLLEPIRLLRGLYDYIVLDTAPSTSAPTLSSYVAADYFILSVLPEKLAIEGLNDALRDLDAAQRQHLNPRLRLLGVLVSGMDQRVRLAREYSEDLRMAFRINDESLLFKSRISRAAAIARACEQGMTVFQNNPQHRSAAQYRAVVEEAERRIADIEGEGAPAFLKDLKPLETMPEPTEPDGEHEPADEVANG